MTRPARLVAGGCAAFAAGLGALAVLQHRAFWTGRFDVGNLVQAVWSTAHGDVLSVTGLTGRQISRLGAHFDPIVVLFAPLWWVWPDASMLLVAQALAVATGRDPRLPPGAQASPLRLGRGRIRARLPSPPGDAVARPRRLPPRRARDAAASLGVLVPRLRPARRVRRGRRARLPDEGADRPGGRRHRPLVRAATGQAARGPRDRGGGNGRLTRCGRDRRAALRPRRRVAVREPLRRRRRVAGRDRQDDAHRPRRDRRRADERSRPRVPRAADRPAPRPAAARTARGADRRARAAAEPPLRDADADVDPLPLHGRGVAGVVRRRGSRRGAPAAALRVGEPAGGEGRRRLDVPRGCAPRPASRLARRAARLRPRDARARRGASRAGRREGGRGDPSPTRR